MVRTVGLTWGPSHLEIRLGPSGPRVVEINARIPGDRIPRLIELTTGVSMAQAYVDAVLGRPRHRAGPARAAAAAIRMWRAPAAGVLTAVSGLEDLYERPELDAIAFRGEVGRRYEPQHSNLDRLGYVIALGSSPESAAEAATRARDAVELTWT